MEKLYDVYGELYDVNGLRDGYKTITGISYDDESYDRPLTDDELYEYLLNALKE